MRMDDNRYTDILAQDQALFHLFLLPKAASLAFFENNVFSPSNRQKSQFVVHTTNLPRSVCPSRRPRRHHVQFKTVFSYYESPQIRPSCSPPPPAPRTVSFGKDRIFIPRISPDPSVLLSAPAGTTYSFGKDRIFILRISPDPSVLLAAPAGTTYSFGKDRTVRILDTARFHGDLLKSIFDFPLLKKLVAHPKFSMCCDCMCGVQGPYAQKILVEDLGVSSDSILRGTPLPDFGGKEAPHHGHADPNLTHAHDLVKRFGLNTDGSLMDVADASKLPFFGAAWDGDADRNMMLGRQFFVIPSDSLAILVDNCDECVPFFQTQNLKSAARSMPTSQAVDVVCKAKNIQLFETPTGWKFFGNLMESGGNLFPNKPIQNPLICGEEAFGTSSNHAREKDGMWATLCWLQILAHKNKERLQNPDADLISVSDIAEQHWNKYGRHYYARYDWEEIDGDKARGFMTALDARLGELKGRLF